MSSRKRKHKVVSTVFSDVPVTPTPVAELIETDFWQKAIFFFFHLLFLTVPLFFTWVNQELFEFPKLLLVYALTALITGSWLIRMVQHKKILIRRTPFDVPILLFYVSQIISTLLSIHPHTSLFGYYTRFHGGFFSTISYVVLFYAFVSNVPKQYLKFFFLSAFTSALLVSLIAIPEHFGHSFSCLLINLDQALPVAGGLVFLPHNLALFYNVTCWVQDVQNRVFATFGQPNWMAAYAITLIPVGLSMAFPAQILDQRRNSSPKSWLSSLSFSNVFFLLVSLLLFTVLIFTKSRSGLVGMAVGFAFFVLGLAFLWLREKSQAAVITLKMLGVGIILCGALALGYGTEYNPSLQHIATTLFQSHSTPVPSAPTPTPAAVSHIDLGGTDSWAIRKIVWTGAIKVWERYPLFGSGVETFAYSYFKDRPVEHNLTSEWDFVYNKAHNEFLNFLATTGVVGFLSYCCMLGSFVLLPSIYFVAPKTFEQWAKRLMVYAQLDKLTEPVFSTRVLSLALASSLVGLSVSNFSGFSTVMVTVLLFLFPAFFVIETNAGSELPTTRTQPQRKQLSYSQQVTQPGDLFSLPQVLAISLISVVTTIVLYNIYILWKADTLFTQGQHLNQSGQVAEGTPLIEEAVQLTPNEDYFYGELSYAYARLALAFGEEQNATASAEFFNKALETSQKMVQLNPVNPTGYNTQAEIDSSLASFNPILLNQAKTALLKAHDLSPTDPKILYHLAMINLQMNDTTAAQQNLETAVKLKPNYEAGRMSLASLYEQMGRLSDAKTQYAYVLEFIQPLNQQAKDGLTRIATASATPKTKK